MPISDYERLMLPILQIAQDKQEHRLSALIDRLATNFNLASDERKELLPSGLAQVFDNRVG